MRTMGLTYTKIARMAGVNPVTVARALAPRGRVMSQRLALRLGQELNFDTPYIVCAHARDVARRESDDDTANELDQHLGWMRNSAFAARGTGSRLAFLQERLRRDLSTATLAQRLVQRLGVDTMGRLRKVLEAQQRFTARLEDVQRLELIITWFERGRLSFIGAEGQALGEELFNVLVEDVQELREEARRLRMFQDLRAAATPIAFNESVFCPARPGFSISGARCLTVFGALSCDLISATVPELTLEGRSLVRIVARHAGFEVGVLLRGRVRLTLSRRRFPEEELAELPVFVLGQEGVVHDAVHEAGSLVAFPSLLYHRVEFLDRENEILTIDHRGNLLLARRLPRIGQRQ
jgi:hypothetical protein